MNIKKNYRWIKIAKNLDELFLSEKNLVEIDIEDKKICLAKTPSGLKACSSKCPHAGGNLSEGKLDLKGNIVCCVHNYAFSLVHGRDTNEEGYFLKIYPVKVNDEGFFVGLE